MDITDMLNQKGAAAAAAAASASGDLRHQFASHVSGHSISDGASDRGISPHDSQHSTRYLSQAGLNTAMRYHSPGAMHAQVPTLQGYRSDVTFDSGIVQPNSPSAVSGQASSEALVQKAFPCSVCGKGFARRSDLARHERIHTGVRPHVCDYPGCHKQFIQRSALTVHARVHTGEKPHMCERCGKPFSDSSSLARHRRIHSGKRPYKCPYADCQKTFTRRTTLTRHQNHHTGTVEEAAAATAAALATHPGSNRVNRQSRSDGGTQSNNDSPLSTPSPSQRTLSMSPHSELAPLSAMQRHSSEYQYMNNSSLPVHLRGDYSLQQPTQSLAASSPYSGALRPTSHPNPYGPPPTLEPPPNPSSTGSVGGSPHMGSIGWHSPSHSQMPSPSSQSNGYVYPDPDPYASQVMGHMYYPNSNIRRPQSTEPDNYEAKPRIGELWATAQ